MYKMFCYQCEQTAGCIGCKSNIGVCGKKSDTANLQEELTDALIGIKPITTPENDLNVMLMEVFR